MNIEDIESIQLDWRLEEGHMLRSMKDLEGYAIRASDGVVGHVKDFYFDDDAWVVRYLVVETGSWLSSRKVLISPIAIGEPDWTERILPVSITKEQVKNSPEIDTNKPVSRQHEKQYLDYYGYPFYWGGTGLWGAGLYPGAMTAGADFNPTSAEYLESRDDHLRSKAERASEQKSDPHLRSCKALMKYHIKATDGEIGHVHSLLIDEDTWAVRYVVVGTASWWLGHQVLIAPKWIQDVRWADEAVVVELTQRAVKDAPPYDSALPLSRELESVLHKHHGRVGYWAAEVIPGHSDYSHAAELASTISP